MSYADAAASSGPIGAEKLPSVPKVQSKTQPSGSVETVSEEDFAKLKKDAKAAAKEISDTSKQTLGDISKELKDLEGKGQGYLDKLIQTVKSSYADLSAYVSSKTNSESAVTIKKELQNPVVVSQILVGASGLVAGYLTYLERHRIKSENKVVLATHGAIITGLILVDGYLFKTYYPKYKK